MGDEREQGGVADALRAAVERTLAATGPAASQTRDRASELLDEVARRGQEARAEIAKRSQDARDEVTRQLEALERRLGSIEDLLRRDSKAKDEG